MSVVAYNLPDSEYNIISSGAASLPKGAISFSIRLQEISFYFDLASDADNEGPSVSQIERTASSIRIKLTNFAGPLGTAWDSVVGLHDNKPLQLSISLSTIGSGSGAYWNLLYSFATKEHVA